MIFNSVIASAEIEPTLYNITLATTNLSVDKTAAAEGETVTITNIKSSPSGSKVYKTSDSTVVVLAGATMAAGTTRTFTMPAFDVTVANSGK